MYNRRGRRPGAPQNAQIIDDLAGCPACSPYGTDLHVQKFACKFIIWLATRDSQPVTGGVNFSHPSSYLATGVVIL